MDFIADDHDGPVLDPVADEFGGNPFPLCAELHFFCNDAFSCRFKLFHNHSYPAAIISSATFLPESSIPPKMGPMRGPPKAALAAMPAT